MKPRIKRNHFIIAYIIILQAIVYYGARLIASGLYHYDITIPLDDKIPFLPAFILIYVGAFLQWGLYYLLLITGDDDVLYRFLVPDFLCKFITFIIFIAFPTTMKQPVFTGKEGVFEWLTKFIYSADQPNNLFPSLHCSLSWLCMRASFHSKDMPKWFGPAEVVFTILVCAATVFVKQHVILDVISGVALAELCLFVSDRLRLGRIAEKILTKIK